MRPHRLIVGERSMLALLSFGLTLLVATWIVATQPFNAPDEASHYVRALSITNGVVLGPKVPYSNPQLSPTQTAFINHDTRAVRVPARLSPPNIKCIDGRANLTGSCMEATPNGNFPPLGYLLPAAALTVSHQTSTGLWLTRAASALQSLVFLLLAVAVLWNGTPLSLLGLLCAISPMVLFTASIMNSSGLEIASCLAFSASVLRISRDPGKVPFWLWVAFIASGAVAILSGPIGLVFALGDGALLAALLGRKGFRNLRAANPRAMDTAGLILALAGILTLGYSRLAGFSGTFGISPIRRSLVGGWHQLAPVLRDAVGHFGALTVPLPGLAYWIWWLLVLVVVLSAFMIGDRRQRLVLTGVIACALAFPVLFWAWVDRHTGFGLQGREVLPPLLLIPLVAGEIVSRRAPVAIPARVASFALPCTVLVVALFQAYAWWHSARTAAGAPNTLRFYAHATWSPFLGWMPWIVAAGLGALSLLIFAWACWLVGSPAIEHRASLPRPAAGSGPAA